MIGKIIRKTDTVYDRIIKISVLFVLTLYVVFYIQVNSVRFLYKPFFLVFAVLAVYIFALYKASKIFQSDRCAVLTLIIISLTVLISWNSVYHPVPHVDYEVLWNGAHQILSGDFSARTIDKTDYFYFFSFQIPMAYYEALFLKIYDSLITLKAVEIITIVLTVFLLYKIIRINNDISTAFFTSTLYASFSYVFIGSGIINNQHIGMFFGALSLYIVMCDGKRLKYWKYVLSAIFLVIGNYLRPSSIIMFIAIALVLFIQGIIDKKKFLGFLIFVAVFIVTDQLINLLFIAFSLAPNGVKSSDLYFKLMLGLKGSGLTGIVTTDAEHPFMFFDLQYYNFDYDKYREACKNYLFDQVFGGKLDFSIVLGKVRGFVGSMDNQQNFGDLDFNNRHVILMENLSYWGLWIYFVTIIGTIINTLRQKIIMKNNEFVMPAIMFCGYFGIYLFFEAVPRYRYEQYFLLFILSCPTINLIIGKCDSFICRKLFKKRSDKTSEAKN